MAWVRLHTGTQAIQCVYSTVTGRSDLHNYACRSVSSGALDDQLSAIPEQQMLHHKAKAQLQVLLQYFPLITSRNHCLKLCIFLVFRSHPAILKILGDHFADGELNACTDTSLPSTQISNSCTNWDHLPAKVSSHRSLQIVQCGFLRNMTVQDGS